MNVTPPPASLILQIFLLLEGTAGAVPINSCWNLIVCMVLKVDDAEKDLIVCMVVKVDDAEDDGFHQIPTRQEGEPLLSEKNQALQAPVHPFQTLLLPSCHHNWCLAGAKENNLTTDPVAVTDLLVEELLIS